MLPLITFLTLMLFTTVHCICIPGSKVNFHCKECFCVAGKPTGCVNVPCSIGETVDIGDPPMIPTKRLQNQCSQRGQYYQDGCSLCYCTKRGFVGLCTPC